MSRYPAFLAGRCSNGAERDRGTLTHDVDYGDRNPNDAHFGEALCGAKPGRRSAGWSISTQSVNCPRCGKKADKLNASG